MAKAGAGSQPLADDALARRLSYFLWSSLPDDELLKAAPVRQAAGRAGAADPGAADDAATRRSSRSPGNSSASGCAIEITCRPIRSPPTRSPATTPAGVGKRCSRSRPRLITHLIREGEKVDELLRSGATFVNETLARFYGGKIETQFRSERAEDLKRRGQAATADPKADWYQVEGMQSIGRGGQFGMPVILSKNSAGQRTSPVKRGFWVVHHLLGQHSPAAAARRAGGAEDREGERQDDPRDARPAHDAAAMRDVPCALRRPGPDDGRLRRDRQAGPGTSQGRTVRRSAPCRAGKAADGVGGLIDYVVKNRMQEFERNLCRKVLGYALGRSVLLSDQPLLEEMENRLHAERRFSVLFEAVVTSPQFRRQRGRDFESASR